MGGEKGLGHVLVHGFGHQGLNSLGCVATFCLVVFVLHSSVVLHGRAARAALAERGVLTTGVITELRRSSRSSAKEARFRFPVGTAEIEALQPISHSSFRALSRGAEVRVRYLPDSPGTYELADHPRPDGLALCLLLPVTAMAGALALRKWRGGTLAAPAPEPGGTAEGSS